MKIRKTYDEIIEETHPQFTTSTISIISPISSIKSLFKISIASFKNKCGKSNENNNSDSNKICGIKSCCGGKLVGYLYLLGQKSICYSHKFFNYIQSNNKNKIPLKTTIIKNPINLINTKNIDNLPKTNNQDVISKFF